MYIYLLLSKNASLLFSAQRFILFLVQLFVGLTGYKLSRSSPSITWSWTTFFFFFKSTQIFHQIQALFCSMNKETNSYSKFSMNIIVIVLNVFNDTLGATPSMLFLFGHVKFLFRSLTKRYLKRKCETWCRGIPNERYTTNVTYRLHFRIPSFLFHFSSSFCSLGSLFLYPSLMVIQDLCLFLSHYTVDEYITNYEHQPMEVVTEKACLLHISTLTSLLK